MTISSGTAGSATISGATITVTNVTSNVVLAATCSGGSVTLTWVNGAWSPYNGTASWYIGNQNRLSHTELVQGIHTLTVKSGYVIRAVMKCGEHLTYTSTGTSPHTYTGVSAVMEAETATTGRTSYTTLDANSWYGFTVTPEGGTANISPSDDFFDSFV